jgi:hypothetical protein
MSGEDTRQEEGDLKYSLIVGKSFDRGMPGNAAKREDVQNQTIFDNQISGSRKLFMSTIISRQTL